MVRSWAALCREKVRRSTARGARASHATLGNSEYVGEQDWDIKSNAWFAASRKKQNMQEKQAKMYSKEVLSMWTTWTRREATSLSGNTSKKNMEV